MEKWVEPRFKGCYAQKKRKRNRKNRIKGLKLELMIMDALKKIGQKVGVNFLEQWTYDPNGRVDWIWHREGWELECKRFVDTKYVTVAWLRDEVVSRFSDKAERKVLVTTKVLWNEEGEEYLKQNNVDVIVVGNINRQSEVEDAIEKFSEQFLNLVAEEKVEVKV